MNPPLQTLQNRNNGLVLKGLSFPKAYLEGHLVVVLRIRPRSEAKGDCWCAISYDGHAPEPASVLHLDLADVNGLLRRQEDHVLIGNVENVKVNEVRALSSEVRLYLVREEVDDVIAGAGTKFFMSSHGGYASLPGVLAAGVHDGEERPFVNGAAIGLNERAISVVQCGTEVMERIPEHGWSVLGEVSPNRESDARAAVVFGGSQVLLVLTNSL